MKQYVIYEKPLGSLSPYAIQVWELTKQGENIPKWGAEVSTLDSARNLVPEGSVKIEKSEDDDPHIVEIWI